MLKILGVTLVLLMALLQAVYGVFAFMDPVAFSTLRGTELIAQGDTDWVKIYASRTIFIALLITLLLLLKQYNLLFWSALFGIVMPATDAWLAINAGAAFGIVAKHLATILYLFVTAIILKLITKKEKAKSFFN